MPQPYTCGSVGATCSAAGPVKMAGLNATMNYGIEKPKGLFAHTTVSAGEQNLGNWSTHKSFNTLMYPSFGCGVGFNRKDTGFFANATQEYKEGVDRTTKVLSEVGKVTDAQVGMRSIIAEQKPSGKQPLLREFGAYVRSESYSARGHNCNYDYKSAGVFLGEEVMPNLKLTLKAGVQKNINSALKPAAGLNIAYHLKP